MLRRLARDRAGNTLAIVAAAVLPLLGLIGGGIDMGRSYLSQSRLQQACDAGVLAARKKLGSAAAGDGAVPDDVAEAGERFFNINFRDGSYGTAERRFTMTLEDDYSISGVASVDVPTTIMRVFGTENVPIEVECEARLNFSNTDIMMVLDTTGSMKETLSGDTVPKIEALREVVRSFYAQLQASKAPGTRIRYGFLPYSVNVNVGHLLKSGWLVDDWTYQGREAYGTGEMALQPVYSESTTTVSGSYAIDAVFNSGSCPSDTATKTLLSYQATYKTQTWRYSIDGTTYSCVELVAGKKYQVTPTRYDKYVYDYKLTQTGSEMREIKAWKYRPMTFDVSFIKNNDPEKVVKGGHMNVRMAGTPDHPDKVSTFFRGCIEERSTYEILDYDDVDLSRALDLDIDLVPSSDNPDTQWRPIFNEISWLRSLKWSGGSFTQAEAVSRDDFINAWSAGYSVCPTAARKLAEISDRDLDNYLDSLVAAGNTYHDIGMIWGGRLLSPTGLFAEENADLEGSVTSRHMIFLTDGETAPRDVTYGTYGIEPLDRRRWSPGSSDTLTQVVEKRFTVACNEVKKRNITVWVVGFGTKMTEMLKNCAGEGHWFQANDASELSEVFNSIAKSMGDLRISR